MCLPPFSHSPGTVFETPSPTPHLLHLPNFQWCAPPLGQVPDSDSIAEPAGCFMVDASPGIRFGGAPPSGERHLGHSGLPCASSHWWPQVGQLLRLPLPAWSVLFHILLMSLAMALQNSSLSSTPSWFVSKRAITSLACSLVRGCPPLGSVRMAISSSGSIVPFLSLSNTAKAASSSALVGPGFFVVPEDCVAGAVVLFAGGTAARPPSISPHLVHLENL
mmetsp:Transcript_40447/g.100413  ORF Transcript_40447/g.100413 Transcript_40447/m.100413 type:complete len:220 (+) Transcript_40447:479-1138(+)